MKKIHKFEELKYDEKQIDVMKSPSLRWAPQKQFIAAAEEIIKKIKAYPHRKYVGVYFLGVFNLDDK